MLTAKAAAFSAGGESEEFGGHKGFGLAVMVDIFCALLGGADFGPAVADSQATSARVSHFFGRSRFPDFAIRRIQSRHGYSSLAAEKRIPADGRERVYYAGLKEAENERQSAADGILLSEKVWNSIRDFAKELNVAIPE